jgi:hypothetical protein
MEIAAVCSGRRDICTTKTSEDTISGDTSTEEQDKIDCHKLVALGTREIWPANKRWSDRERIREGACVRDCRVALSPLVP